jgi:hypothetical protein
VKPPTRHTSCEFRKYPLHITGTLIRGYNQGNTNHNKNHNNMKTLTPGCAVTSYVLLFPPSTLKSRFNSRPPNPSRNHRLPSSLPLGRPARFGAVSLQQCSIKAARRWVCTGSGGRQRAAVSPPPLNALLAGVVPMEKEESRQQWKGGDISQRIGRARRR